MLQWATTSDRSLRKRIGNREASGGVRTVMTDHDMAKAIGAAYTAAAVFVFGPAGKPIGDWVTAAFMEDVDKPGGLWGCHACGSRTFFGHNDRCPRLWC